MLHHSSFSLLVLSEVLDALCSSIDTMHFGWLMQQPILYQSFFTLTSNNAASFYLLLSLLASSLILAFCVGVMLSPWAPAMLLVVTASLLIYPPMAFAASLVEDKDAIGSSSVQVLLALAISLSVLKSVATGMLKLRCLPSRWSYITYASYASVVVSAAGALSPVLISSWAPMAGFASPYDFLMRTNILADGRLRALTAGLTPLATVQFLAQLAAISQLHVEGLLTYPSMPRVLRCFAGPSGRPASRHARGSSWRPRSCCDVLRLTTVAAGTALFFIILSVALALPLLAPTYAVFGGGTPHRFDQFSFFSRLRAWHFGVRPPADEPPTVEDTRHARFPRSVAGKSLYMLMVDRFAQESHNGRRVYGCSGTDHWCGGDIRSIVERLDYIEGLGFDCVWMTPVIEQFGATRCFEPGTGATGTLIKSRPKRKKG